MKTNALQSLYGGKDAALARDDTLALAGNVGGQARKQETWTPAWIIMAAHAAMGGIEYDPCAASDPAGWFAEHNDTLPAEAVDLERRQLATKSKKERAFIARQLRPFYLGGSLLTPWRQRNFVNQPFKWLEHWLRKCAEEAKDGKRIVQIGPVRPHRSWWRPLVKTAVQVVYLRWDVVFQGHSQAFPAPLALCSWNCIVPYLGERETGRE